MGRDKNKGYLAAFVERQTHFYVAVTIDNRLASEMYRVISEHYELCLTDNFKTHTVGRGKEFACDFKLEVKLNVLVYFAGAYSSCQRRRNENANAFLQEFFPKKAALVRVTGEEINDAFYLISHLSRNV